MEKQRTLKEYRAIDLTLFAMMLTVCEFLIVHAARWWFPEQLYTVSLAAAITSIVYMRWGLWGGLHALWAGFIFCLFSGGEARHYLIYCAGNLFSLPVAAVLRPVGPLDKEKARTGSLWVLLPISVQLLMQAGRAVVALALGTPPAGVTGFFTTDSLSMLFTVVIVWITKKLDGIYEDQKHYLLRIQAQEE